MRTLTKEEVIEALKTRGVKASHQLFTDDEYIYCVNDHTVSTEDGYKHDKDEFWGLRQGKVWDDGWFLVS